MNSFIPCSIKELMEIVGCNYSLFRVDADEMINRIITSSGKQETNSLFLPFAHTDEQLRNLIIKGVTVLTNHKIDDVACIVVDDPGEVIFHLCKRIVGDSFIPFIIVSGSEGKTTTKRMVSAVIQTEKKVYVQSDNYNTLNDLWYSLNRITPGSAIMVQEADESNFTTISRCSRVLRPTIALVTNIAEAHIRLFGSKEALIASFRGITDGIDQNGIVIILTYW